MSGEGGYPPPPHIHIVYTMPTSEEEERRPFEKSSGGKREERGEGLVGKKRGEPRAGRRREQQNLWVGREGWKSERSPGPSLGLGGNASLPFPPRGYNMWKANSEEYGGPYISLQLCRISATYKGEALRTFIEIGK